MPFSAFRRYREHRATIGVLISMFGTRRQWPMIMLCSSVSLSMVISGPFYDFAMWLQEKALQDDAEGFYLPYLEDSGGVAPEPWHLSYRPGTIGLRERQTADVLDALWGYRLSSTIGFSPSRSPLSLFILCDHI